LLVGIKQAANTPDKNLMQSIGQLETQADADSLNTLCHIIKSKLELKSNSSEILPVNCKFICNSIPT